MLEGLTLTCILPTSCWECPHLSREAAKCYQLENKPSNFYQVHCVLAGKEKDDSWKIYFQLTGFQIDRAVRLVPPGDCPLKGAT